MTEPLKTVYVIPYDAHNVQNLRTVNIQSADPTRASPGTPAPFPTWLRSATPPPNHEFATVMAAGAANSKVSGVGNAHIHNYYSASGVHFDGSTHLKCDSLTATDNGLAAVSFWFNADIGSGHKTLYMSDTTARQTEGYFYANTLGVFFGKVSPQAFDGFESTDTLARSTWHHIVASIDATGVDPVMCAYLDDVLVDPSLYGISGVLTSVVQDGKDFWVGADTHANTSFFGSMADFWLAPGVSLLNGSGDITPANRRKFITADGLPANPSGFPAGAAVLLTGGVTGWQTNGGDGGSFAMTGTLTASSTFPSL